MSDKKDVWKLKGLDTFAMEEYSLAGEYETEELAEAAAKARLEELERTQPTAESGGQGIYGIQDQVFVVRPDGSKYRFMPPSPRLIVPFSKN